MNKSFRKRLLSIVLAVLMVATSIPLAGISALADTQWTEFASSDFTTGTWSATDTGADSKSNYYKIDSASALSSADYQMGWTVGIRDSVDISKSVVVSDKGISVPSGVLYLSNYTAGGDSQVNPLSGLSNFKIDFTFSYTSAFDLANNSDYNSSNGKSRTSFMKLYNSGTVNGYNSANSFSNAAFSQSLFGWTYDESSTTVDSYATSIEKHIDTTNLTVGKEYHYVMAYDNGHVYSYIADSDGSIILNFGADRRTIDTSKITGLYIGGSRTGHYAENIAYKNVTLYSGKDDGAKKDVDTTKDKYVFTYFTGNSTDGETLHMAVSDDGKSWEALNANQPIWSAANNAPSSSMIYGTSDTSLGVAASNHVRDPYAFQAEDGSYYVLATDLDTQNGSNWGNNTKLMVWHLDSMADLATTEPWYIETTELMRDALGDSSYVPSRAWAPEAIYDKETGHYMLFWACGYINGYTYMYYTYTDDFKTFLTTPRQLITTGKSNIDGNITYDDGLYYLWFKDEDNGTIGVSTATHANGPYTEVKTFTDKNYSNLEGPEIYYIYATDSYILMTDAYSQGYMVTYSMSELSDSINKSEYTEDAEVYMNYLTPRHGSVMNITSAEYQKLIDTYGKVTYDGSNVESDKQASDYLIARYFTTSDPSYDATGHGHTLSTTSLSMTNNYNGKVAAIFDGTAKDNVSAGDSSTRADSGNKTEGMSWAKIASSDLFDDIDINAGVTFSWYAYTTNCNSGRFFDWTSSDAGEISWDDSLGTGKSQNNQSYAYCASNMEFGAMKTGSNMINTAFKSTSYNKADGWHQYTMTISNGYVTIYVDNSILKSTYKQGTKTTDGTPISNIGIDQEFFDNLKNGNLLFGISAYAADDMFNGYISDFRVYNRALSFQDNSDAAEQIEALIPTEEVGDNASIYWDPMEEITSDSKLAYGDYTVNDEVYGNVLNLGGFSGSSYSGKSQYTLGSSDKSKGYTISFYYNPGAEIKDGNNAETVFAIGNKDTTWGSRKYLELTEAGEFHYVWDATSGGDNYVDVTGVFGDNGLTLGEYSHITINVEPQGDFDTLYFYVNGKLTKKVDVYATATNVKKGYSVHDYLADPTNYSGQVWYGTTSSYWANATEGFLDEFKIYNGVYSAQSVYKKDNIQIADKLLNKGIEDYKESMAKLADSDYVYLDMMSAYEAYDAVCRYQDSVTYGDVTVNTEHIVNLYNKLESVVKTMEQTQYKKPTDTVQGYKQTDKNDIEEKFTHNMLTSPTGVFTIINSTWAGDNHRLGVSSSAFVWLYTGVDGDTPTAPYTSAFYKNSSSGVNQYAKSMYITNSIPTSFGGLGLDTTYPDGDGTWNQNANAAYSSGGTDEQNANNNSNGANWWLGKSSLQTNRYYYTKFTDSNPKNGYSGQDMSNQKWYYASGYGYFSGNLDTFKVSAESDTTYKAADGSIYSYVYSYTPSWNGQSRWQTGGGVTSLTRGIAGQGDDWTNGTTYVINFATVSTVLQNSDRKNILANITDYTTESSKALLEAYDALTSQKYALNSVNEAEELAKTLKTKVDALEGIDLSKLEKIDYEAIEEAKKAEQGTTGFYDAATKAGTADDTNGAYGYVTTEKTDSQGNVTYEVSDELYTTSSWDAYESAATAVTDYFTTLNPYGKNDGQTIYDQPYVSDGDQIKKFITNIDKSKETLVARADYSPAENVTGAGVSVDNAAVGTLNTHSVYTAGNGTNYANQKWTLNTWIPYDEDYQDTLSWSSKSDSYKADTEKYAVTYEKNSVEGPYIAFDADGNVVTSDDQTIDHYTYIGVFYENAGDAQPSQFETGDYVLIDGEYVQLNGHRYYATAVDKTTESKRQAAIKTSAAETQTSCSALATVDTAEAYQNYNSAQSIFANSDQNAYNTATKETIASYGSTTSAKDYTGSNKAVYVTYNGAIYYNTTVGGTDTYTSTILNDINDKTDATRNVYHITFEVYTDGVLTETVKDKEAHVYGDVVNLTYTGSNTVVSWVVSNSTATTAIKNTSNTYKVQIQEDSTAKVYVTTPDSEKVEVLVKDYFGRAKAYYVAAGTTATVSGSTITFSDGQVANNVECNYMAFTSFTKGGEEIADGTVYAITEATAFVAKGTTAADTMTYKVTGGTFADGSTVAQYKVDDKITITADDENCLGIALATDDGMYVLTYDSTYSIFAFPVADTFNGTVNFVVLTNDDAEGLLDKDENGDYIKAPQSYGVGVYNASTSKLSMYCTMSTGSGATITERGVLLTRGSNNTADTFIKGATDVKTFRSTTDINAASYMYSIKLSSTANVYARSYVCYEIKTSLNGIDVTVPLVAYGPVVSA